ncbi:MAG: ATP-dependent DNA helicase RecG [Candidatus Hydrogenedentes bacterium]|nr:ATP-dependent DNA helicase RecG [Candidatus Hydrogenedentota bacterium]
MPINSKKIYTPLAIDAPVQELSGIGNKRAATLAALGIYTVKDLLFHLPREYRDRSLIQQITSAEIGEHITIEAEVISARSLRLRGGKTMALLTVRDNSGDMKVSFFGRGFLAHTSLKKGTCSLFTGKVGEYKGLTLQNPEYEPLVETDKSDPLHTGRIVPIYPLTEGITQRQLRQWIYSTLSSVGEEIQEILPESLLTKYNFQKRTSAIHETHFPTTMQSAKEARVRFAYEELLTMQLGIFLRKAEQVDNAKGICHDTNGIVAQQLRQSLPFALTPGQQDAVDDIFHDMASSRPMFRLLQGDVGCGKTLVALHAVAAAVDSGNQVAFMAPTEILAEQHYGTLQTLLNPLGIQVALLTGTSPNAKQLREMISCGKTQVVIGTHALYQQKTVFHHLGLVIIDEQHRFGVSQREALGKKSSVPDILHTTATPIPRTLAITLYGGMDLSVIPDMPPGRLPVKTALTPDNKKEELYQYIRTQAEAGYQSYIICPLVEESEHFSELTPLIDHYISLSEGPLKGLRSALLHGRLDPKEKEEIMTRFKAHEIDVLFATTVIEVGVDSPKATTIIIENAGRFGLTQLHQLRGRVGRSNIQSWCFLVGKPTTPEGRERLDVLRTCNNGFDIAEADMKLRGPGDYCGARQSGLPDFRVANLLQDARLLDTARYDAIQLLKEDAALKAAEHQMLAQSIKRFDTMFI